MVMATDADINIEHRLTEVDARARSNTKRPVSYTHLDVYKRQSYSSGSRGNSLLYP